MPLYESLIRPAPANAGGPFYYVIMADGVATQVTSGVANLGAAIDGSKQAITTLVGGQTLKTVKITVSV